MHIKLTSRAALLRALSMSGLTIEVLAHWQPQLVGTTRTPKRVQTNGYYFDGPRASDGKVVEMFADIPKASQLLFADGDVTFYPGTFVLGNGTHSDRSWTLRFIAEGKQ